MTSSSIKASDSDFDRQDWVSAYCNVDKELTNQELKAVKGSIPRELNGHFYRNGPGRLERNGQWVHHPFDGDGMIASFRFHEGKVNLTNRFVRTKEWEEEEKAGKFLYRGVFGTQKKGGILNNLFDVRLKNIANTNVIKIGNQLLALWEAASPHALDPVTLNTYGLSDLAGALKKGEAFSAHPRFDPGHHGEQIMVNFGVNAGPKSTIRLMEFNSNGELAGELISSRKDEVKGFAFLHDFAITPNWAIFLQNSILFNPIPFLLGMKGAGQCLSSKKDNNGNFIIIPRESGKFKGEPAKTINAPEGFVFHHLNAFEEKDKIILDSIFYRDFPSIGPGEDFKKINFDVIPEGQLKRCEINLLNNNSSSKLLTKQCCEFAMVNPNLIGKDANYSWMAIASKTNGNGPLQGIKKLNLHNLEEVIWNIGPRGFVSEPLMVPKPNSSQEDLGWVIVLIWNSIRIGTDLVILRATDLREEAIIELPINIPHGLHGSWAQDI